MIPSNSQASSQVRDKPMARSRYKAAFGAWWKSFTGRFTSDQAWSVDDSINSATAEFEQYVGEKLTLIHELKKQLAAKEQEKQDQLREFLLGQIELLDAMEQKEASLRERYEGDADALKLITNHTSLQKRLWRQLERYGVKRIDFPGGKLLVGLSKVVDTMPDSGKPNESIISIVSQGYVRGSTVLREAELIVVKN
ncbi:nucleotide exchange factor GrpE [Hymenobacter taeanensis]|uniref:Nucleotide exchange factor GrpE n=1 Tax=Hymenobacter taeanensis TaxID=2735321 RepID=A0A6M6BIH7_9BACT|nr:nucleotide exchange factor GrpE [Hymenobacter taeanensis]QJX47830.1 nucleotide exchange factor GrpE [Hymenobacter taeanensis]